MDPLVHPALNIDMRTHMMQHERAGREGTSSMKGKGTIDNAANTDAKEAASGTSNTRALNVLDVKKGRAA